MKRNGAVLIAAAVLFVAGCEIVVHWLLGSVVSPSLLAATYLCPDAGGKYFYAGMIDNTIPALVLGLVNGWVGFPRWSVPRLWLTAVLLAVCVVALMPLYSILIGPQRFALVWGWRGGISWEYVSPLLFASLAVGGGTGGACQSRRSWDLEKAKKLSR